MLLDLRDLDLSQLRLTKKDLETLSSLTPSLSKSLQEQLLAQLPPNQAKKLSRTLSVQNGPAETSQTYYQRSISNNNSREVTNRFTRDSITPTNEVFDTINNNDKSGENRSRFRRSASRDERFDDDSLNNNPRKLETSHNRETTLSPTDFRGKYYSSLRSNKSSSHRNNEDIVQTCFSPEPEEKPKSKRLSRFLSPEFTGYESVYDEPKTVEKSRELESHKILRELCDKKITREKSVDKEPSENRISYFLDKYATNEISKHLFNGNFVSASTTDPNQLKTTPSRSDTSSTHSYSSVSSTINDKILDELNVISLLNGQLEKFEQEKLHNSQEKVVVKKKVKSEGTVTKKVAVKKVKEKILENTLDDSRTEDLSEKSAMKRESKLARPKSYISKDSKIQLNKSSDKITESISDVVKTPPSKLSRPKSFPSSKITPPKEIKFTDSLSNILNAPSPESETFLQTNEASNDTAPVFGPLDLEPAKKTKKVIKVVKKSSKAVVAASVAENETSPPEPKVAVEIKQREKSPDKKSSRGLLYTIGQKFEKLRDTTKKEKKEAENTTLTSSDIKEKKKKIKAMLQEDVDEATRQERKSKIDAMIKNLKDKSSLPHNTELTESGLIKRAVSVEEMPNASFNKNTVNKVLGLFKRIEKENSVGPSSKVQNAKSTSYLSSFEDYDTNTKERPKSSGFVHKIKKNGSAFEPLNNIAESKIPVKYAASSTCPDCKDDINEIAPSKSSNAVNKRQSTEQKTATIEEKERLKNNRKGLMLDFSKFACENDVKELKKSSSKHNNYSFPPPLPQDINQSSLTPTYDSLTNYSSSPYDESSVLLSPSDDVGFDRWSTCSEDDHHLPPHPTGTMSLSRRLSRSSQATAIDETESPESVVDRIRRKSFYSRFNEKKPKRVSNIVGSAAKDYYRERSRPLEYTKSATSVIPDLSERNCSIVDSHHHIRSSSISRNALTSASASATRSLSQTRGTSKYSSDKSSDTLQHSNSYRRLTTYDSSALPPAPHHHHYHDLPDEVTARIRSNRSTVYDSSSSSSNTPSLTSLQFTKRRSYVSTPPSSSSGGSYSTRPPISFVDSYATIGRKMRQYNSRSYTMLDPNLLNSSNNYTAGEHRANGGFADLTDTVSRFADHCAMFIF